MCNKLIKFTILLLLQLFNTFSVSNLLDDFQTCFELTKLNIIGELKYLPYSIKFLAN